ncbi:MAG: hypothetical protein HGA75_05480 [Thiobacillus sp.]|nr:hypothetical protein [Thiobacillus sp.]
MSAAVLLVLAFCVGPVFGADYSLHYTLLESPARPFPTKLVLLPPQVTVKEISAGGVLDRVPEWTAQANANIQAELATALAARPEFEMVVAPTLAPQESELVDQYLASYMVVGIAAHWVTNFGGSEWAFKRQHFDYTLGEGLDFLREKTGADAAIMVIGEDYVSSSGRKAAMIVGALFGVGIPGGVSVVSVGVVDLRNGDILWMHHSQSGVKDLKDKESVHAMLGEILATLPGKGGKVALR